MTTAFQVSHANSFNALRLFAASQVVFVHTLAHLKLTTFGRPGLFDVMALFPGVPVFFAISGYLIALSWDRSKGVLDFYGKRARRIYPGLVANIAVLELLWILAGQHVLFPKSSLLAFAQYELIYMLTGFSLLAYQASPVLAAAPTGGFFPYYPSGVLWTLTVELSFYVVIVGVLAVATSVRSRVALILALMAGSLAVTFLIVPSLKAADPLAYRYLEVTVLPYFWMFGIGMLIAVLDIPGRLGDRKSAVVAGLGVALVAVAVLRGTSWAYWKAPVDWLSILQVTILSTFVVLLGTTRWLDFKWVRTVDLSYGLYLWHMLVVVILTQTPFMGSPWGLVPAFAGGFALAALSWFLVEEPFLRSRRRKRTASPADGATQPADAPAG